MGLFDAFRGGQAPGMYAPWMTYDPGAPQITPSQPVTPAGPLDTSPQSVTIPKGPSFWDRMNAADPNTGLSKWQQLGLVGASLRDDPSVFANQQNSMMEQGKLALSNQLARQRMGFTNAIMGQIAGQGGAPAQAPQSMINGQPVPPMPSPGVPQAQPGAMPGAPQVGGVPNLPGARSSPLTPAMRKSLAMMAVLDGKPDQAATILDDKHHILAGPGGVMYDGDSGEVIGRIPTWKYTAAGDRYDEGDPNAPKFLGQAPANGADRVFDQRGNPIGWRMGDGSLQAIGASAAADAAGKARGAAPYTADNRQDAFGAPVYGTLADRFGPGGPAALTGQRPDDAAYRADTAKNAVTQYQGIQAAGQQALTAIPKYQRLGELLDGYNGNKLSPAGVELAEFAHSMGWKVDPKIGNKEAAQAITNQLALSLRDPSQGGGMPGSLSNSDRDFLVRSVPNLAQTDQGRKQMVQAAVALNQRNADVAAKARQWQQRFGRIDAPDATGKTFSDYLQAYSESHPLFGSAK